MEELKIVHESLNASWKLYKKYFEILPDLKTESDFQRYMDDSTEEFNELRKKYERCEPALKTVLHFYWLLDPAERMKELGL